MKKAAILFTALLAAVGLSRLNFAETPATSQPAEKPADAVVLFDGTQKSLDDNFTYRNGKPAGWVVADGVMTSQKMDIISKQRFQDFKLHVEFCEPKMGDDVKGQERGNSGVYLQGRYEIQVLDSFGLPASKVDCGAVYNQTAPLVNAALAPGEWQTYDIEFHAAKYDADKKKTQEATVTLWWNGKLALDNVSIKHPTGSEYLKDSPDPGPVMLQYHHNSVQFRNVWVVPGK
jgi:hypothetical protein